MSIQPVNSQEYLRFLNLLHTALMLGQVFLLGVVYFVFNTSKYSGFGVESAGQNEVYIAGGFTILSVLASAQFFGAKLKKLQALNNLSEKLAGYRSASILRYAFWEVPSLTAVVLYLQTNNLLLLIFAGLILLLFLVNRPTKARIVTDLELSPAEQASL